MGYLFLVIVSGIFLSGYFAGVDAAVGASATTCSDGGGECDAGNHEVCDVGTTKCVCDVGYSETTGTCNPDCGDPTAPADATVALAIVDTTSTGATATVTCVTGYEVSTGVATATITCEAGGTWTAATCSKKDCGVVTNPVNGAGVVYPDVVTTYEATATVTCDDESAQTLTCGSSGSWSAVPTCPGCGDPVAPADATVALDVSDTTDPGAEATVTCVTGYEVSGGGATATITCQAGGSWTAATCNKKDCGDVADPANGDTIVYLGGVTTYGTTATVTCDDESTQILTCESTGSWSAVPTCPGCGDPSAPADATVALDTSDTTDPAATATVTCVTGYEVSTGVVATATITCQGSGSWTAATCNKKDCGAVSDPANGATVLDSDGVMTYQATATVNCDDGSSQTITCESSGSWSVLPTCPAGCGDPSAPADATVALAIADATGTGATATVTCVTGYEVSGAATATITCQAGGTWTAATCSKKDCGAVSNPSDGTTVLVTAGVTTYGATSTVTCNAGFGLDTDTATATITCQADASWGPLPTCTSGDAANCGAPSPPENGAISTAATANTEGHEATVACDTGYTLDGSSTMTCQYDNSWSTPGTCSGSTSVAWSFYVLLLLGVMTRLMKE